jgi:hypothetical protein
MTPATCGDAVVPNPAGEILKDEGEAMLEVAPFSKGAYYCPEIDSKRQEEKK